MLGGKDDVGNALGTQSDTHIYMHVNTFTSHLLHTTHSQKAFKKNEKAKPINVRIYPGSSGLLVPLRHLHRVLPACAQVRLCSYP